MRLPRRRTSRTALYERLLDERDKHIRILVAEIDWLRAQLGRPSLPAAINPTSQPVKSELGDAGWVTEREEAQEILEAEGLDLIHLPEILDGLGMGNSTL